jgi:hypothetical protein
VTWRVIRFSDRATVVLLWLFAESVDRLKNRGWGQAENSAVGGIKLKDQEDCEQEDAGIDIVTDGEQARQHFVHGFLENIEGVDFARRVTMGIRNNRCDAEVPTVTGPLRRKTNTHGFEAAIARAHTRRRLKFTLPGPMTMPTTATRSLWPWRLPHC